MNGELNKKKFQVGLLLLLALALLLRLNGVFRGLTYDYAFHPDVPKQISALGNYLQGYYVWYVGNLFYDGYPFGLNHLDELCLRAFLSVRHWVISWVVPEASLSAPIDKSSLYYYATGLRVLYSMGCLGLLYLLTYRVLKSRSTALLALLLATLAPLALVVSHIATGDIGVDLFTLVALMGLAGYARRGRMIWLLWAGLATGLAFSCKYQGALVGTACIAFILLESAVLRRIGRGASCLLIYSFSGLMGVIVGTPAVFIDWNRTWKNMRDNFVFIQEYNVTPEFMAQPAGARILHCLTENSPLVFSAMGWTLSLLALGGLVFALHQVRQLLRGGPAQVRPVADLRRALLILALLVYPFAAIIISVIGKPAVQPFHFSYLLPVLIFGACYFLQCLWVRPGRWYSIVAGGLLMAVLFESASMTRSESFFWGRGDTYRWARQFAGEIFNESCAVTGAVGVVKTIYLEAGELAVFRNRATAVSTPDAEFWNQLHIAPIPNVPLALDQDWLFPNGPVFPRNDRCVLCPQDETTQRHVALYAPPTAQKFGVRSGSTPVQMTLIYGAERVVVTLLPHSQKIVSLTPVKWRFQEGSLEIPGGCYLVALRVAVEGGNAWVTLLMDERETRNFEFFGGGIQEVGQITESDIPTPSQVEALKATRFMEGREARQIVPDDRQPMGYRFPAQGLALPGGAYLLECVVECETATAEVAVKLDDFNTCQELIPFAFTNQLVSGYQVITTRFSKAFAPYEAQLDFKVLSGRCRLERWTLRPDVEKIRQDLVDWTAGGTAPAWRAPVKGARRPGTVWAGAPLMFGDRIRLARLNLPASISKHEPVLIDCEMQLDRPGLEHLLDYMLFVHLLDAQGHTVHTFNFRIWQTLSLGPLKVPFRFEPPAELPAGEYGLEIGAFNLRTLKRLPVVGKGLSSKERRKWCHVFGRIRLTD